MSRYLQFRAEDGSTTLLVEVEDEEVAAADGVVKAGVRDKLDEAVAVAESTFEAAVRTLVRYNAQALILAVRSLADPPSEVEITFGLKATGEVGNLAIAKAGGEANYNVKLNWKQTTDGTRNVS